MSAVVISCSHARASADVADAVAGVGRNGRLPGRSRPSAVVLEMRAPRATVPKFEDTILPHLDAAYNLARWLVHGPVEAEDVVQDACLRAVQFFPSFRGDNGKAWLLRIVRNTAYSKLRSPRVRLQVAAGRAGNGDGHVSVDIADPGPGPDAILERAETAAQLKAAIARLPVDLRECLVLRELEEFSYSEIARIAGVPIGTVMSRLHRARRQLMAMWTENAPAARAAESVAAGAGPRARRRHAR